jgi:hypothetical protein
MKKKKKNGVYFNEKELKLILGVDDDFNRNIFMPNEIFSDLVDCKEFKPKISKVKCSDGQIRSYEKEANANHIAFAFSYVYLASYLYRYARFIYFDGKKQMFIDDKLMYMICNTSPNSRGKNGVNYITKKNGLLEKMGYIRKQKDYPVRYYYTDILGNRIEHFDYKQIYDIEFTMKSEVELPSDYPCEPRARKINYPVKAFHYDEETERDNYYDGYFYEVFYTTKINIQTFIYCMSRKELGTIGFYLYCFLKSKCDYYKGDYISDINNFVKETGIGKSKLIETLKILEKHNMISNTHNTFVTNLPSYKKVPANTYSVFDYTEFNKHGKKEIMSRKVMSYEQYDKKVGVYLELEPNEDMQENVEDFSSEELSINTKS